RAARDTIRCIGAAGRHLRPGRHHQDDRSQHNRDPPTPLGHGDPPLGPVADSNPAARQRVQANDIPPDALAQIWAPFYTTKLEGTDDSEPGRAPVTSKEPRAGAPR